MTSPTPSTFRRVSADAACPPRSLDVAGLTARVLRKLSPREFPRRVKRTLHRWRERMKRWMQYRAAGKHIVQTRSHSCGYDVFCLPVMPWHTRVQRPQQLMRLFAEHGQRVFYAGLEFRGGNVATVSEAMPGVFETILPGTPGTNVYGRTPTADEVARMAAAIDRLRVEWRITSAVVVAQLPFWTALALELRKRFGWPIVYECMDDHTEFSTNSKQMFHAENLLIAEADLAVVSSDALWNKVQPRAARTVMIRNACEYEHFAAPLNAKAVARTAPPESLTVGFFGAVADWFDSDLIADLAEMRPGWKFELIGSTHTGKIERLQKMPNVALMGEKPYAELPRLMAHWDCHLIPFRRIPLTEAMNPVKAYEILATGKPLVATDLPELRPMARDGLLTLADDARGFAAAIERELAEDDPPRRERRRAFAAANTWQRRWEDYDAAIREMFPLASIITPTFNNLPLNKAWLHGILAETDYPNYEIIVVDNNSTDGTAEWLAEVARAGQEETAAGFRPRIQLILNKENRGFAAANNQALRVARGQYLCLLNNDTIVTRGWLSTLIGHLRKHPELGMVGPVSNNVGNEAKVPVGYRHIAKMPCWAEDYCRRHDGQIVPIEMLGFFCVVMPREVYRRVGELDERFGLGYFEDDDYCRRIRAAGYRMCFVRDAFVHHWLESSFRLLGKETYIRQFSKNQRLYKEKWNADEAVPSPFGRGLG
jgi:GT2 family glycosyltransferase